MRTDSLKISENEKPRTHAIIGFQEIDLSHFLDLLKDHGYLVGNMLKLVVSFKNNGFSSSDIKELIKFFEENETLPKSLGELQDLDDLKRINEIVNRRTVIQHRGWFEEVEPKKEVDLKNYRFPSRETKNNMNEDHDHNKDKLNFFM